MIEQHMIVCPKCGFFNCHGGPDCPGNDTTAFNQEIFDVVGHPPHYTTGKIEVIDFIIDQKLGYCLGNAIKYICRCNHKGHKRTDLLKAIQYLTFELEKGEA